MATLETRWTLGFLIGTPIWIIVLLALLIAGTWLLIASFRSDNYFDSGEFRMFGIVSLALFVICLGIALLGYYPYKAEYHQWRTVEGKVTEVSKRLIAQDKSMSERYVLVIDGQPYGVDDTRASLVKQGDTVRLSCKRDWQYASTPGYVCRWAA